MRLYAAGVLDIKMALFVMFIVLPMFVYALTAALAVVGGALWWLWSAGLRRLGARLPPSSREQNAEPVVVGLAFLGAVILTVTSLFYSPKEVHLNPYVNHVRVELRTDSVWSEWVRPRGSDCFTLLDVTHVSSTGMRTSVKVNEWDNSCIGEDGEGEPERVIRWATNGSDRVVVITSFGDTICLPDALILSGRMSEKVIVAYLQGQSSDGTRLSLGGAGGTGALGD
jgi:hypothetical protein